MLVPIENKTNLSRDVNSMGIINTNKSDWKAAQSRKLVEVRKMTEFNQLKEKVNNLDTKLNEILDLLKQVKGNTCQ